MTPSDITLLFVLNVREIKNGRTRIRWKRVIVVREEGVDAVMGRFGVSV